MLKIHHLMHKVREVIIVVVHVGAVKIYVTAVQALRNNKERWGVKAGSNSVWHKKWCISEFDTPLKANVLFCRFFFLNLTGFLYQTQGTGAVLSWLYGNSNMSRLCSCSHALELGLSYAPLLPCPQSINITLCGLAPLPLHIP
jgi:hypothetical protein